MEIDLEQLDRELGLEDDPLDELDELDDAELGRLLEAADRTGRDISDLLAEMEASGIAFAYASRPDDSRDRERLTAVRKCRDCSEPARPRKSPNGPRPQRCEEHTKTRKKFMDREGSKARAQYWPCCVTWQMDGNPDHRGLCPQCKDGRKESRKPVSDRETEWLVNTLGTSGWHVEKAGEWLQDSDGWQQPVTD